jgi:hypothetical protein
LVFEIAADHLRVANADAAAAQSVQLSVNYPCPSPVDFPQRS